jgi:hypothetical protein
LEVNVKRRFTGKEVKKYVCDSFETGEVAEIIQGKDRRWTRRNTIIIKIDGKHYKLYYEQGLTECQENEYEDQEADEVTPIDKEVTTIVRTWKTVEDSKESPAITARYMVGEK